jgi:hypothetical protein
LVAIRVGSTAAASIDSLVPQWNRFETILGTMWRSGFPIPESTSQNGKGGIPRDELLAAHAAGDDRLVALRMRYGAGFVPARVIEPKASSASKRPKTAPKKAPGERVWLEVVVIAEPRWWATRASRRASPPPMARRAQVGRSRISPPATPSQVRPAGPGEARALALADLVLIPARPSAFDVAATLASRSRSSGRGPSR